MNLLGRCWSEWKIARAFSLLAGLTLALVVSSPLLAKKTPAPVAPGEIDLTGFQLTFDEEFNSLSLSTDSPKGAATWFYWPPYGPAGGYSDSNWNASALSVSGGILTDQAYWDPSSKQWQSGNISSMDSTGSGFAQEYGYFEARMQMPVAGTGAWPAFWLNGINSISQIGAFLEVDVAEWYGNTVNHTPSLVQQASHNWNADGSQEDANSLYSPQTPIPGANATTNYHIYGVLIDPIHITWYIDGLETNQINTPTDYNQPLYLMVDYALGGGWPLSGKPFPRHGTTSLLVDWVRVYQIPQQVSSPSHRALQGTNPALASLGLPLRK